MDITLGIAGQSRMHYACFVRMLCVLASCACFVCSLLVSVLARAPVMCTVSTAQCPQERPVRKGVGSAYSAWRSS